MQRFAKGDRNAQQEISKQAQGTAGEGVSARAGMIWPWPRQKHDLDDDFSDFLDNSAWNLLNSATWNSNEGIAWIELVPFSSSLSPYTWRCDYHTWYNDKHTIRGLLYHTFVIVFIIIIIIIIIIITLTKDDHAGFEIGSLWRWWERLVYNNPTIDITMGKVDIWSKYDLQNPENTLYLSGRLLCSLLTGA